MRKFMSALVVLIGFCLAQTVQASYISYFYQAGANVIGTGSGTINITALSFANTLSPSANVLPVLAQELLGQTTAVELFTGLSGPSSFGLGSDTDASSGSGNMVGVIGYVDALVLPNNYVSGTSLSDAATWDNTTLSGLGMTPGTYNWTWGRGATADSYTVIIGQTPPSAPEPATFGLLALGGLLLLAAASCRRARKTQYRIRRLSCTDL